MNENLAEKHTKSIKSGRGEVSANFWGIPQRNPFFFHVLARYMLATSDGMKLQKRRRRERRRKLLGTADTKWQ